MLACRIVTCSEKTAAHEGDMISFFVEEILGCDESTAALLSQTYLRILFRLEQTAYDWFMHTEPGLDDGVKGHQATGGNRALYLPL